MNGDYSVSLPNESNIHIIERPNIGYDFGAWSHVRAKISISRYDHVFFMNTSVRGPFMRDGSRDWPKPFLDLFRDDVKLVGTTINILDLASIGLSISQHNNNNNVTACPQMVPPSRTPLHGFKTPQKLRVVTRHATCSLCRCTGMSTRTIDVFCARPGSSRIFIVQKLFR